MPCRASLSKSSLKFIKMYTKLKKVLEVPVPRFSAGPLFIKLEPVMLLLIMASLWFAATKFIYQLDITASRIDVSTWLYIMMSIICFVLVLWLCWYLLNRFWEIIGLPALGDMVLQFNTLKLWQQLGFYWLSFALLLLAAVMCLAAIC